MGRIFEPAIDAKTVPVVRSGVYATGQVFLKGSVLGENAGGELIELATDPAANTIVGVALEPAGSKPGLNVANDNQVVFRTGVTLEASIVDLRKAPNQIFSGRFMNATGTLDVAPTQTIVGETRNVLRLATGEWVVEDVASGADVVKIVDIVTGPGIVGFVLFRFLTGFIVVA